jgi:hypothetical protein
MPDLLAHVLFGYAVFTLLTARVEAVEARHVPLGMVGAALPDLAKVRLLVPSGTVGDLLGAPFSWLAVHRLGAAVALAGLGALAVSRAERRTVFGVLLAGALGHLGLDAFVVRAAGLTPPYLYPLSWWRPPSGDLYLSSQRWPTLVALGLAAAVYLWRRGYGPGEKSGS